MDDRDFCEQCGRVVEEGTEHSAVSHLSSLTAAMELQQWRKSLEQIRTE